MTHARVGKKIPPGFSLDVDFPIGAGITAIYGPSGAGKSLLLELIAGFMRPDGGRILLDDVILFDAGSRVHLPPRRRGCGYVGQRDSLFPHMTLRQNLSFAAAGFPRLDRARRVNEMLERFQLTASAELRPRDLASVLRLKAAVARVLLGEPKLLLFDERAWDEPLLHQVRSAHDVPILLVTSDPDLCCAANQMIVMEAGRILQRGSPQAIFAAPASPEAARLLDYRNLFQAAIAALDPSRKTSRLEAEGFALAGPYIPGHFRGDQVWVAIRPEHVRVHAADGVRPMNSVEAQLVRAVPRLRSVRLEFSNQMVADVPFAEYTAQKDNKSWLVELPAESLIIL